MPLAGRIHGKTGHSEPLRVDDLTDTPSLEALAGEWAELWERCPYATPFQRPEWLVPWWRRFGGDELWTLTLRRGGRLVGIAPFFVYPDEATGARRVLPLGAGNTDYLGMLVDPRESPAGVEAVWAAIDARRERWDVLDLKQLRSGAPELAARAPAGWEEEAGAEPCPVLDLRDAVDGMPSAVPKSFAKRLAYYERRIGRAGVAETGRADAGSLDEVLDALVRLHGARWHGRGESGVLAGEAVRGFHGDAARGLLACGALRLYALRLDGRIVAAHYGLAGHGRAYYYIGGFDPGLDKLSPGTAIVGHAIRDAVGEGAGSSTSCAGRSATSTVGVPGTGRRARRFRHGPGGAEPE